MTQHRLLIGAILAVGTATISFVAAVGSAPATISNSDLALIGGVIRFVEQNYVRPVGSDELTKDALKGMLSRLDPHSDYMDEQEFKESQGSISGKFGGVGMELSEQNGVPKIIAPIDGTPAARAGIQPGDLIVLIGSLSTSGMGLGKVVNLLRGAPGTSVTITVSRGENPPFEVTLTREIVQVQSVKSNLEPNGVGYIRIIQFTDETPKFFKKAVNDLKDKAGGHLKGLVLDLRNDPGGLLSASIDVAGNFLEGGQIVSIRGRNSGGEQIFKAPPHGDLIPGTPIVVLINGASASASEIVAGALQDRHRAIVMGTQSFGKGSVQTIIPLKGHGALRLTTALYFTPSGRSIQDEGISPDVVAEAPKDQQVPGAVLLRESALNGAFANPGTFIGGSEKARKNGSQRPSPADRAAVSAPIKANLIGSADDGQLKAALSYLDHARY
jgi:carboxyl-terminal processing protease